jgi:bifunctional DNase/RNase
MIEMFVREIFFDGSTKSYILIMQDEQKEWTLPIWIGPFEAQAISMGRAGTPPERPQTHDLFLALLDHLKIKVLSTVIMKVEDGTFFASLHLLSESSEFSIDARPSDAIAIAIRAQAPIYAKEEVLHQIPDHPDFKQLLDSPEESEPPDI